MKLTKTLRKLKNQLPLTAFETTHPLISFGVLVFLLIIIWFGSPYITFNHVAAFAQPEKRMYIILFIFLLWLLKLLLLDLDTPNAWQFKDPTMQKKLQSLNKRFLGAIEFFKKTTTQKNGKSSTLNHLPWFLFIGPGNSGKTTFLANSKVNFLLQKQFDQHIQQIESSENVDWWITRDACIVDIPGKYITSNEILTIRNQKINLHFEAWRFFLRLIKKYRGKNSIAGVLIALPLPELMKQSDSKKYQWLLRHVFDRLQELQKIFPAPIPCHFVITKCDLLSGFEEFFVDNTDEEINQSFGVNLMGNKAPEKLHELFAQRFNLLIKRLNQQLIWRLHQERNPMSRPYIKDFPLQVERLKECIVDVIKKLSQSQSNILLQGVYLTSGTQTKPDVENIILEDTANHKERSIQLFQAPAAKTRAYFIKHFITHHVSSLTPEPIHKITQKKSTWRNRILFAVSGLTITLAVYVFGKDFQNGVKQTQDIQSQLSAFQLSIQQFHNPEEHLIRTSQLLDKLLLAANAEKPKFTLRSMSSFYTNQSQQKMSALYQIALQVILEPELRDYFADYLKNPVNRNTENVYTVLKTYLMFNDRGHFQAEFILDTLKQILPKSISENSDIHLFNHLNTAFGNWQNISLNETIIEQTRKYLTALPSLRLSYIILKNFDNNNMITEINLGQQNKNNDFFVSPHLNNFIPTMFTAKNFATVYSQQTMTAAQEAMIGNWVLGAVPAANNSPDAINELTQQLRIAYVNNYVDIWETFITNITLADTKNLSQLDAMIASMISEHSSLLQLLHTFYNNTYFEPIVSSSAKLQALGNLLNKNTQSNTELNEIFSGLNNLHNYIQQILSAEDPKQIAYELMTERVKNLGAPDPITQLHYIASKSPEPLHNWLDKITNDAWHSMMQEAGRYIDLSWQNNVVHVYQNEINNHYPFSQNTNHDLELIKFVNFFGNPGVITNFYNRYLTHLVDASKPEWRWKNLDNKKLPFSDETLHQIQQAMRIHHAFFPNGDNKLYVQFTLQPYLIDKQIKSVKININDKQIVDDKIGKPSHLLAWPSNKLGMTSVQLTLNNQKMINRTYPGEWGWFRLVNQAFESSLNNKQSLINLSSGPQAVKYVLFTEGQNNPFISLNLHHFHLSSQMTEQG